MDAQPENRWFEPCGLRTPEEEHVLAEVREPRQLRRIVHVAHCDIHRGGSLELLRVGGEQNFQPIWQEQASIRTRVERR